MTPRQRALLAVLAPLSLLTAVVPQASAATDPGTVKLSWTARGPAFSQPVAVTSARDGSGRLFVVQQTGLVRVFKPGGTTAPTYLDVSADIDSAGERGLLGLTFSPTFTTDHYLWVSYTMPNGALRIKRFRAASTGAASISKTTGQTLLDVPHPDNSNHNAGQLAFGRDGLLYIGTGDGGGAGDAPNNALNLRSLSGKILRIDPRHSCSGKAYCIPSSNPYHSATVVRREIWAYGLRNPWKFSFDRSTGVMYIADVGQGAQEEVNRVAYGTSSAPNFGWSCMEGTAFYDGSRCGGMKPSIRPVIAYSHRSGYACGGAIIGGYLYRGSAYSYLRGLYIYGDYCYGRVFLWNGSQARTVTYSLPGVSGFGETDAGEIWAVSVDQGKLFQMSASRI